MLWIKEKLKRMLKTQKGAAAVTILMIALIPVVFLLPSVALDIKVYTAVRSHLLNSLDAIALSALNESTVDRLRSDKILKIKSQEYYVQKVEEGIRSNLKPLDDKIIRVTDPDNPNYYELKFFPDFDFTPDEAVVEITFPEGVSEDAYSGADLTDQKGVGVELKLVTKTRLPVSGRLLQVFNMGDKDISKMNIQVSNRINGIRVKAPEDYRENPWELGGADETGTTDDAISSDAEADDTTEDN